MTRCKCIHAQTPQLPIGEWRGQITYYLILLLWLVLAARPARSEEKAEATGPAGPTAPWWERDTLTGDWCGAR